MKSLFKTALLSTLMVFSSALSKAERPDWKVNPDGFQYNMTMLAVANADCKELTDVGNMIGVFVGNECRGVAETKQVVGGRYLASLFVYSNLAYGETVTFKIYDIKNDTVYNGKLNVTFQENAAYGTAGSPHIVYSSYPCYNPQAVLPVSNFMSPNGDGINDVFAIADVESYPNYSLSIYNAFGLELYYKKANYDNTWNGTYEGNVLPTGAYYYLFREDASGKSYTGVINIVKPE